MSSQKDQKQTSNKPGLDILGKLSDLICFNFRKSFLSIHKMMCSQGSALSLGMSHESKSLFLGVWQHKVWLAVPDRSLCRGLKKVFIEVSFPIDKISRLQGVMLKVFVSQEHTVKRLLYQNMVIFKNKYLGLCNIRVSLLLSVVGQMKVEPSVLGIP